MCTYRKSPPKGIIIKTKPLPLALPRLPRVLNGDTSEDAGNQRRSHEQHTEYDGSPADPLEFADGEDSNEEEEDRDFGEVDGWDVGDLRDPCVLETLVSWE